MKGGSMKLAQDYDEIKAWAEKHQGNPQKLDHMVAQGDKVGIRINFPGPYDDVLLSEGNAPRDITWEEFFRIMEDEALGLEYSETVSEDDPNASYRFIKLPN